MKKWFPLLVMMITLAFVSLISVNAHTISQEGILEEEYIAQYGGYYIGGESVGWSIDENYHMGSTSIIYRFEGVSEATKALFRTGAEKWSPLVMIAESPNARGVVREYNFGRQDITARFTNYVEGTSLLTGHLTTWDIEFNTNPAVTFTAVTAAHELGHVIGLNDLYASLGQFTRNYTQTVKRAADNK